MKKGYLAYLVTDQSRREILHRFKPKYSEVVCHHVTWKFPATENDALPEPAHEAHVIGYAHEDGIEALVVTINGHKTQKDGRTLHITLSLDRSKGKKPVHSNDVIKKGFEHVTPFAIHLTPSFES